MALKLITSPAVEPVTLAEVKKHLNEDSSHNDDLINFYIRAVRSHWDVPTALLNMALVAQTWELHLDGFPTNEIKIPFGPLQSITHIKYDDADGNEQTLNANYTVDTTTGPGWVLPAESWPATYAGINSVRVRFISGWPVVSGVATTPDDVKAAIMLMVGTLYRRREDIIIGETAIPLPYHMQSLLGKYVSYLH